MAVRIAFIGLGVMGFPMAGHLSDKGYNVVVYNRTKQKAEHWRDLYSGQVADTPADAAVDADIVLSCVGNDNDVRDVLSGQKGALSAMKSGSALVDHTTTSARLARELAAAAKLRSVDFMDAPVSGGQAGAKNGKLTVMCGGDQAVYERIKPVMSCYACQIRLMGKTGAGQLTKMVNQICIAGILEGLAEGLCFAEQAGLDIAEVVEVISKGAAQSWQMDNRSLTMKEGNYDHGFAVDWMRKDLGICLSEAESNGAGLPLVALIDQFYKDVQNMGGGRWDTSSLIVRLQHLSALERKE
ncbi:2-(hydroxymethyl)glutarate dehydrogenase [invertebrate metagenome]|uniref:2-(Hydroxymethyl)glutarate dehydrogenase n=1 Tax=invertebrate metagenome TaxID=1711999 RepID=A0A2H9T5E8_9ZZZZ